MLSATTISKLATFIVNETSRCYKIPFTQFPSPEPWMSRFSTYQGKLFLITIIKTETGRQLRFDFQTNNPDADFNYLTQAIDDAQRLKDVLSDRPVFRFSRIAALKEDSVVIYILEE